MTIEVRFRALDASEPLREHVLRAVHFHLSRFGRELSAVSARIGDVNGPKGGVDKRCQLHVRGPRIGSLVVAEVSADAYAAVDVCAERAGRSVGRELERHRTRDGSSPRQRTPVNGEPSI
jgi:putative sigma-54 modulation protein